MIDLGNGYFVCPTAYGYNLCQERKQIDKKTGDPVTLQIPVSYHGSLVSALNAAMKEEQRKALMEGSFTVKEAVEITDRIHKEFLKKLEDAIGSKETLKK